MGIRIGIDIGSSTTKIVAFEQEKMLAPMVVRADSQVASLYGAFGRYLYENNLELSDVDVYISPAWEASMWINRCTDARPTRWTSLKPPARAAII